MGIRIVLDTVGGDNGYGFCVSGAVEGLRQNPDIEKLYLAGHEDELTTELAKYDYDKDKIEIIPATEDISPNEAPVKAVVKKKDSSLVKGMKYIKEGKADAFISAGSSGAILAGGQLIVGKAEGVMRAPLAMLIPTSDQPFLLLDCGANVDVKPEVIVQFAKMGSVYMEEICGIESPRVAIVNVGLEEEKGNQLVKAAYPLLKETESINFTGSIEARELPYGRADVVVCDAFVGNVIIKLYEGLAKMILMEVKGAIMSSTTSKIGGALIKKPLKGMLSKFSASNKGGAPLLGLNGLVVKIHGNSKEAEVISAISQCAGYVRNGVNDKIIKGFENEK